MQNQGTPSLLAIYFGVLTVALAVVAFGLSAVAKTSIELSSASGRDKSALELQMETSREIKRALATPVTVAPLPPITLRPAREIAAISPKKTASPRLSQEAMNAMAMDQSPAPAPVTLRAGFDYPTHDRFAPQ